jgi:hypothetical protein
MRIYVELELKDKDGRILVLKRFRSHSYLKQLIAMLRGIMYHTYATPNSGNTSVVDTSNTARSYPYSTGALQGAGMPLYCPATSSEYGLVVGSGTNPNTVNTYALQTLISHGSGSGQLSYGSQTFEDLITDDSTVYFRIIRTYTNNSGANITVNEIGLYAKAQDSGGIARIFCIARDVLSTGVTVGDGQTLTVRYKLSLTVS